MEATKMPDSTEKGRLGVMHVPRMVERSRARLRGEFIENEAELHLDHLIYDGLGLGLEPTIRRLHQPDLDLEGFERWVEACNGGALPAERVEWTNGCLELAMGTRENGPPDFAGEAPPLGPEQMAFFDEHGYVVLKEAVTRVQADAALAAVWEAAGMSPDDPESWYRRPEGMQKTMFEFFHHPALEANRHAPRIHRAFQQLWNRERLMVTYGHVSINPPERESYTFDGVGVHWDTSLQPPVAFDLQGLLYLTDTPEEQGAFRCVPGFHRKVDEWVKGLPAGTDPRAFDFSDSLKRIGAAAGDLVIFQQALPHGASPNRAAFPRVVQYITWYPPEWRDTREWL